MSHSVRHPLITLLTACACLLALALVPSLALANGEDVLRDCNDNGKLDKQYKQSEYRDAIENIPTDLDEYTDCRDVIRRAQLGLGTGGGGGSTSGGATAGAGGAATPGSGPGAGGASANATDALANATPQERAALAQTTAAGDVTGVRIGKELIRPKIGVSSSTSLPTPLAAIMALLAAAALAAGAIAMRNRFFRGPTSGRQTPAPGSP